MGAVMLLRLGPRLLVHVVIGPRVGRLRSTTWALVGPGWRWERGASATA